MREIWKIGQRDFPRAQMGIMFFFSGSLLGSRVYKSDVHVGVCHTLEIQFICISAGIELNHDCHQDKKLLCV